MYASIFDYRREFKVCHSILRKYQPKSVLELGCGAGNMAKHFVEAGYDYTGLDISREMLAIAKRENPGLRFLAGNMSQFSLPRKFDAVVIWGRSFCYMTTNGQVQRALKGIHRALEPGGVLLFDNFEADGIFKDLSPMQEEVQIGTKRITRTSTRSPNLKTGWTWDWRADWVIEDGETKRKVRDFQVLRAFTWDELRLFLELAGFTDVQFRRGAKTILTVARVG